MAKFAKIKVEGHGHCKYFIGARRIEGGDWLTVKMPDGTVKNARVLIRYYSTGGHVDYPQTDFELEMDIYGSNTRFNPDLNVVRAKFNDKKTEEEENKAAESERREKSKALKEKIKKYQKELDELQ